MRLVQHKSFDLMQNIDVYRTTIKKKLSFFSFQLPRCFSFTIKNSETFP